MKFAILTVGDELVSGRVTDTNAAWLSQRLHRAGHDVVLHASVGDSLGALAALLRRVEAIAPNVLICGGLGPTDDDRTRGEVARAADVALEFRAETWDRIVAWISRRRPHVDDRNRRQAYFPAGAEEVPNIHGTAPAFRLDRPGGGEWWVLPGVPSEMQALYGEVIGPRLVHDDEGESLLSIRFFGIPEATLDGWISDRCGGRPHHICVTDGELDVRVPPGPKWLEDCADRWGDLFLGVGDEDLATRLVRLAQGRGLSIATAESCTGGGIAYRITAVPGASGVFRRGAVTYSNESKAAVLGVDPEVIDRHGAVSDPVARAMATGARGWAGADLGVGVTGIAGPDGGTPDKPVGTTFVAVANGTGTWCERFVFPGSRDRVRSWAVQRALHGLWCLAGGAAPATWR